MGLFSRQRNILDFTLSSLLRRKGKQAALVTVYTLVVTLVASVMFFTGAIRQEAAAVLKGAPEIMLQRIVAGRHDLMPVENIERASGVRGVTEAKGRLWGYYFDPALGANYTLIARDSQKPGSISIGPGVALGRLAAEGDLLPMAAHNGQALNMRITSILPGESSLVAADLVLVSEKDFRHLSGVPEGYVTDIALRVSNKRELATIARKLTEAMPGMRPIIRDEILRTYESVFNWRSGIIIVLISGAVLSFIIFAWDRASGLSAEERREIGILKAIGWETSDVLIMKFWEGALVSLSSFGMGILLAYAHVFIFDSSIFAPVLKGWSTLYPAFRLVPSIDYYQVGTLFFLSVAPYTIATIVPSWRSATTDPDTVMRG
jgi:ABC-type lipoprotein release transport system permease subunit